MFERLTWRDEHGVAHAPVGIPCYVDIKGVSADRLAAYEDSGLSPEEVQEIAKALKQAIADMNLIAGDVISEKICYICEYYTDGQGCELDGTQFDDDGECHFTWRGEKAIAEVGE